MPQQYSWEELLPIDEANQAANSLAEIWQKVVRSNRNTSQFNFKKSEPKLTEYLHIHLCKLQNQYGLTGFWINEQQTPYLDSMKDLKRTRQDITYSSNASKRFSLVFEFKKVTKTSSSYNKYKGEDGMRRFVDGEYSIGEPLAAMVAIVESCKNDVVAELKKNILNGKNIGTLSLQKHSNNEYFLEPSIALARSSAFDTLHCRPQEKAPPGQSTIILAHIFLSFEI